MADTQGATAVEEQTFEYPIRVEDAGPATKKVHVEIPQDRIASKLEDSYKELRQQAAIPGFRIGHAPRKLIEKRFSQDVKDQVRRQLISESYEQAVEKNNLQVIGEPQFENPELIQLPEQGALTYSFEVEVQPDFTIPELTGLKVKRPKISVTDANVDQAMQNLREQQGTLVPVEDRGVEDRDYLMADVHLKVAGNVVGHQHDAQVVARPGRIAGLDVPDLDAQLRGMKSGETRTIKVTAPESFGNEAIRGKEVEIEVALKDIKKLEPVEVNQEFLESLGFENEQELRDALREQMVERIEYDVQQAMREQVNKHLLDTIQIELPAKLSDKQEQRIVQRRAMDLMMRGIPQEQIAGNIERLRTGARDEAARELKLFFVLQKIAADQNVDVDEAELNGRIAMLAAQRGERPEKLKQEMSKDGTLANLYIQMREQKAVDRILESAEVEDVDVAADKAGGDEGAASAAEGSAGGEKKSRKKKPDAPDAAGEPAGEGEQAAE
ncbi:MAG TPA: trigger factor [Tepidisphaeraceae bacterium]|nr:trigger factor [Tepidisphaeraceae bacterium]